MNKKKFNINKLKLNINKFKFNINKLKFNLLRKLVFKKSPILIKKNKNSFFKKDYKSLYLTAASSFVIILFFFSLPLIFEFKKIQLMFQ